MTLGSGSGLGSRRIFIKVTVRFGFNERKRLIRVFGLRSGLVRRPAFITNNQAINRLYNMTIRLSNALKCGLNLEKLQTTN